LHTSDFVLSKSDAVKSVWQAFENYVTVLLLFTVF